MTPYMTEAELKEFARKSAEQMEDTQMKDSIAILETSETGKNKSLPMTRGWQLFMRHTYNATEAESRALLCLYEDIRHLLENALIIGGKTGDLMQAKDYVAAMCETIAADLRDAGVPVPVDWHDAALRKQEDSMNAFEETESLSMEELDQEVVETEE